ncbi:MAG: SH3 domain-containing protein, partial [Terracidiphilus sp.]
TGWLLGNRVDVDVSDDIAQYAEGQRIVGAYVIAKVNDPDSPGLNHEMPEYVTALSSPKSGLPFDFDQIRVFTWSLKHHRYETAFRIHPIQGFLPVRISSEPAPGGTEPIFSFQISSSMDIAIDPDTGIARPVAPRTISYALRDTMVHRVGPDLAPIPITHPEGDNAQKKAHRK